MQKLRITIGFTIDFICSRRKSSSIVTTECFLKQFINKRFGTLNECSLISHLHHKEFAVYYHPLWHNMLHLTRFFSEVRQPDLSALLSQFFFVFPARLLRVAQTHKFYPHAQAEQEQRPEVHALLHDEPTAIYGTRSVNSVNDSPSLVKGISFLYT